MAKKPTSSKTKKPVVKRKPRAKKSLLKPKNYKWTWADFDDWNVEKQKDRWPDLLAKQKPLTAAQKAIVKRNQELLEDKNAWQKKIAAFLVLLKKIEVEYERNTKRDQFAIHFDWAIFANTLECNEFIFPCDAFFNRATFEGVAEFDRANFEGDAVFEMVRFKARTWFHEATFKRRALFIDALFLKTASFFRAAFKGIGSFNGATFKELTMFDEAIFEGKALFGHATFEEHSGFSGATIEGDAHFSGRRKSYIFASGMVVRGNLIVSSKFKIANFRRLSVEGVTNLSGSIFETVPDFRDCKLDRSPEVAGMKVPLPEMTYKITNEQEKEVRYWPFKLAVDNEDVTKYRKLKAMALAANDHEKDGEFFAYEMMAKRGHETVGFFPLLLNSLYWLLSFYGQSIARPCWAMIVSFFAFWASGLAMIKYMTGSLQEIGFAAVHSTLNSMPLIGTLFRTTSTPKGHTSWYDETYHQLADKGLSSDLWAAVSAGQQIIGAVLFFLLFLGLRNKFRIR